MTDDDGWSPERLPTLSRTLGRRRCRLRLNCCWPYASRL